VPTVLEVIQSTTAWFEKRGIESARLNAEHLATHALGKKKRLDLYMEFDRPLGEKDLAPMRELVRKRGDGIPLQHLLGTTEFFGREFLCDARALVPRPETEQLVELVLESKIHPTPAGSKSEILDVGTGSGVIAITLALELPEASVTAIDQSPDALALAADNAKKLGATVSFVHGDLLPAEPASFDVIAANLPYIPTAEIAALAKEVQHDPVAALDGGADGLDLVRRLIEIAKPRMNPDARIFLEIGHDQATQVAALFEQHGYREPVITKDLQGVARFVSATAPHAG
jgi:release factor glutamine methyltransferase